MNAYLDPKWKADRASRIAAMKVRLLALPDPAPEQAKKLAAQDAWLQRNYKKIMASKTFGGG